ncbi:MAG: bifunctional (p)ppGpp synthetase/guanosine-3',5'-bis(diphosphate) 3'-pyrophosphohydrolase, partial [Spirochaetales bacterium]|nr:bifunctional (p)ppGpp synthetase/guanosine-3',5'-bis(diphosphate) 3'-pyrophosphohydrolase [Spirochaetales bacterium]
MRTLLQHFEEKLTRYSPEEREKIMEAAHWAEELHHDQLRASGEPYVIHPIKVAEILIDLEMDCETIIAALLHDILEDTDISQKEMQRRFGKQVVALVNGV